MPHKKKVTYAQLNENSSLADLIAVGKQEAQAHDKADALIDFHRKWRFFHARRLGHVFEMIGKKPNHPTKKELYKEFQVSQSTENRCSRLWDATRTFKESELQDSAVMEAYEKFGVLSKDKSKKQKDKAKATAKHAKPDTEVEIGGWLSRCELGLDLQVKKVQSGDYEYDKDECLAFITKIEAELAALKEAINAK